MKTKYYRYTLQGEHSVAEAQSALGDAGSQGLIVRVDTIGGQTYVYIASQASRTATPAARQAVSVEEVPESEVTKMD